MKAKVIYGGVEELQNLLYVWLMENPTADIAYVAQSEGTSQEDTKVTVVTIFHKGHY